MSTFALNEENVTKAIEAEIKQQVDAAFAEIIEDAKERIEKKLRSDLAHIAMRLHRFYSVEFRQHEILITVRNEA